MDHATVYYTPSTTLEGINRQIASRQLGTAPALVPLSQVPASTRREVKKSETPTHSVAQQQIHGWYPQTGIPEASFAGYAHYVDNEAVVRASNAPLTKCLLKASYQPTASSDLYSNWSQPAVAQPHFADRAQEMPVGLVSSVEEPHPHATRFNNHTRQQTKN